LEQSTDCGCSARGVVLLACSGGSNVGQIANNAAVALTQLKQGKMSCVVGLAAHIPEFDERMEEASFIVAIDGCDTACARKAVEHMQRCADVHVVVTELGIDKEHQFDITPDHVGLVAKAVTDRLAALQPTALKAGG